MGDGIGGLLGSPSGRRIRMTLGATSTGASTPTFWAMISASQWRRAILPLLDDPDHWRFKGKLAYQAPVGWTLRGVHGEGSGLHRDRFYVSVIYMPLFVPSNHLVMTHGRRVSDGTSPLGLDDPELSSAITEALNSVPTESESLEWIARTQTEEACYACVLLGRLEEAQRRLSEPFAQGDERPFVREARARMAVVLDLLRDGGTEAVEDQLTSWRDATWAGVGGE